MEQGKLPNATGVATTKKVFEKYLEKYLEKYSNTWKKRRGTHHHTSVVHPVAPCGAPYGVTYLIPAEPYYRRVLDDLKKETQALLTYPCTLKCRESWAGISYTPQYLAYEAMETSAGPLRSAFLISY